MQEPRLQKWEVIRYSVRQHLQEYFSAVSHIATISIPTNCEIWDL